MNPVPSGCGGGSVFFVSTEKKNMPFCIVVNSKCVAVTNDFKLGSLISVNTHVRSKSIAKIEQL